MRLCVWPLFDSPLCTLHSLSHLQLHPPDLHLHLLCGSVRREFPCALPRTLWSKTHRSQNQESYSDLEQYTNKYSTYRVAQHDHISSREHAWVKSWKAQDCTSLCPKNNCHPRVMSHSLPHLALTTSTSSLSPISSTSPLYPTVSPSHTRPMALDPYLPCDVPRQSGGSTQISSLTGYEGKSVEIKVIETEVIEPEDLEPRRIELDRNLGTDPYQSEEGFMRNFWKSWCRNVLLPGTNAFRLWLSGEHCRLGSSRWKTANHLECQLHRGNLMHCYMSEEQVQIVLKLHVKVVSGTECTGQTCCNVFMKKRRTRKLVLTCQMWEDLFLKEMKTICSVKQNLNLWDRNIKLDPSIIASLSFSNKVTLKDWSYRTLNTDILSLDGKKFVYNKSYLWRKRFSEIFKSEASTKREKWKQLKNYELTKSQCKNWEKVMRQNIRSLLSNRKCTNRGILWGLRRTSRSGIKVQWEIVLRFVNVCNDSKFSLLSRDKRLPLDTWNTSGFQENVFW